MSVKELTEMTGIDISTIYRQLDILKKNEIVEG
jgi:Fe2+ or Zn2+ uptake regulation protein